MCTFLQYEQNPFYTYNETLRKALISTLPTFVHFKKTLMLDELDILVEKSKSHFWSFMHTLLIRMYNGYHDFVSVIKEYLQLTCKMNSGIIWAHHIMCFFCF